MAERKENKKTNAQANLKGLVFSAERKLNPSDGRMYAAKWDSFRERLKENEGFESLCIKERTVRGTISNRLSGGQNDAAKQNASMTAPNIQTVDCCYLPEHCDTLAVNFTLKVLGGASVPSACNRPAYAQAFSKFMLDYANSDNGYQTLAYRYAYNLAAGRFLWRNRVGAEKLHVHIEEAYADGNASQWDFDCTKFSLRRFDKLPELDSLARKIADALGREDGLLVLKVWAFAQIGDAQEVYPSEELVREKNSSGREVGRKSKYLFSVDGIAALHSQKIGNAIRTIDTWYQDYGKVPENGPIAAEPYGAVTTRSIAYRSPVTKTDFYTFFDKVMRGEEIEKQEDKDYMVSVILRGGVFGGKED